MFVACLSMTIIQSFYGLLLSEEPSKDYINTTLIKGVSIYDIMTSFVFNATLIRMSGFRPEILDLEINDDIYILRIKRANKKQCFNRDKISSC